MTATNYEAASVWGSILLRFWQTSVKCEGTEYLLGNQKWELEKLKSSQRQKFASVLETGASVYNSALQYCCWYEERQNLAPPFQLHQEV